ncbi:TolC family protein [Brevibacillus borstelensis]|uniref:TolC family protein n=1 Tax=Brevibacillus borstelensis TaxID=45462 RepID=UPI002E1D1E0A|nr:TolC family protein [Brevibacillus borstelensis]MED1873066.1 TolC family protein [Brevibacillus borstelensis]
MKFPYSSKKWLTLSIAAVMATSIGVGAVASESGTAAPASQTQGSQQNDKATTAATADNSKADANKTDATKADTAATEDKAAANGTADAKATETKATETKATDAKNTSPSGTTGTTNASDSTPATEQMTLAKAIEQAMQTNSKIQTARLEAKTADINQSLAYDSAADMRGLLDRSLEASKQKYIGTKQADLTKKLNQLAVKVTENQVKLGVQQAYYNLLHAQADLELKKQSLNRAQTQLKVAKAAFDVGTKAKTDILQAEMGVAGAQAALAAAENTLEINGMKFNEIIGVDVNKKWKLTPENKQIAAPAMNLQQAQEQALKQRHEIVQKEGELELANTTVNVLEDWSMQATYNGRIAKNNVEKAKLAIEEQNRQIKTEVAEAYLNLNAARVAIDFRKKAMEAAAESYRLTNLRFENGLATTLEVIQAEEELAEKENQHLEAIRNYNLAVVNFENALGVNK